MLIFPFLKYCCDKSRAKQCERSFVTYLKTLEQVDENFEYVQFILLAAQQ